MACGAARQGDICRFCWLGRVEYARAREMQKMLAEDVSTGGPGILLFLEHPPTYTLGHRGRDANMLLPREALMDLGAAVVHTDRGGDITFHGPGQLIGYPIIDLKRLQTSVGRYMRKLEEVLIQAVSHLGVLAERCGGYTGVWVNNEKVAAIGVKITARSITQHGFALNVNTDLNYFRHIIPCGIKDKGVATLSGLLGREIDPAALAPVIAAAFGEVFRAEMIEVTPESILLAERSLTGTTAVSTRFS